LSSRSAFREACLPQAGICFSSGGGLVRARLQPCRNAVTNDDFLLRGLSCAHRNDAETNGAFSQPILLDFSFTLRYTGISAGKSAGQYRARECEPPSWRLLHFMDAKMAHLALTRDIRLKRNGNKRSYRAGCQADRALAFPSYSPLATRHWCLYQYSNRQSYEKLEVHLSHLPSTKVVFLIDTKTHFVQGEIAPFQCTPMERRS
jgi:hypothetical protein